MATAPAAPRGATATAKHGPSIVDLTFLIWALAIPLAFSDRLLNSDGDLARHIAMGEYMLRNGRISHDVFSYTKAGEPFVVYEWLSELFFALLHRFGGVAAVAIGGGLLLAATYSLVVWFMRRKGVDPLFAYLTGILAALLGAVHWLARPHLFTMLALVFLLFILEARSRRAVWLLAPLFAVWGNLHPGFVIGLLILGVYAAGDLIEAGYGTDRAQWLARARLHGLGFALALVSTVLNPHGISLHLHISSLLGNEYLMGMTNEFMSPTFHGVHGKLFLLTLLAIIAALSFRTARLAWPHLLLLLFTVAASLVARRNIPLFAIITLPLLAVQFNELWQRLSLRGFDHVRQVFRHGEAHARPGRLLAPVALVMLALAWQRGSVAGLQAVPNNFDPRTFPVAAVAYGREADVQGRIFHPQTWGGYLVYAWPAQRIFIDGLTDFFGEGLARSYMTVISLDAHWDRVLEQYDISLALLPPQSGIAYALRRDGWRALYEDETAIILKRPDAGVAE